MKVIYRGITASLAISVISACGVVAPNGPQGLTLDQFNTQPSPGSVGVSITQPLKIVLKEELELSSVGPTTVHLMPGASHGMDMGDDGAEEDTMMMSTDPIPGNVSYDPATRTISFTPTKAMEQGHMYHVHASDLMLKGGKRAAAGLDTIKFSFTTAHAHEFYRKEFDEFGQVNEVRYTQTSNNERVKREEMTVVGGVESPKRTRHYTMSHPLQGQLMPGDQTVYWQQDSSGLIERYEVLRTGTDGKKYTVRVEFPDGQHAQQANGATDPIRNVWTPDESHSTNHMISYQYEPVADRDTTPTPWPASGNPSTDPSFRLDNASIMEMNHSAPIASTTSIDAQFQHRHIFYGDLGTDKKIDFNPQMNPAPQPGNDRVAFYHTRDLVDYKRTHEWSWAGSNRSGTILKYGSDGTPFTNDDVAYRLRLYIYDDKGRVAQRVTYEIPRDNRDQAPYGLTRSEWTALISSNGYLGHNLSNYFVTSVTGDTPAYKPTQNSLMAGNGAQVIVHSYRIYEYNDVAQINQTTGAYETTVGALKKVTVWHQNDTNTNLFKEQTRFYSTQPNADGRTMYSSAF
ncbi:MAG: Ig-like domain-containing protein [Gammaproteobacteria bacterium]|nr:Ig-like domain-containing protein [Gammaproteobacteria bacterium]